MFLRMTILSLLLASAGAATAAPRTAVRDGSAVADLITRANAALEQRRAAEADSLASLAITRLDAVAGPDRLQLASALVTVARARAIQRSFADSVAVRSARRALALLLGLGQSST